MACLRVQHGLVHVDVDHLRAALHLLARDRQRLGVVAVQDQAREGLRAGDVGALADVHEQRVVADVQRLQAGQPQLLLRPAAPGAARNGLHRFGDRADVRRRGAAAAADDVQEARLRELAQDARHVLGRLVVLAHLVGQAGIRVQRGVGLGDAGQLLDVRAQVLRAERAVEPDRERPGVRHRIPERADGLAGQRAARAVGDRAGDHHRQPGAVPLEIVVDGEQRGLGVERVEDGLDQQQIDAALDQAIAPLRGTPPPARRS